MSDDPLTFEEFTSHSTTHSKDLVTELEKPGAVPDQLMTEWVQKLADVKNNFLPNQYYAIMFVAMNDMYLAFNQVPTLCPETCQRAERLIRAAWRLADDIRLDGQQVTEDGFKDILRDTWTGVLKVSDRNLLIQWAGILWYSIYELKGNFENEAQTIMSEAPEGIQ